MNIVFFGTSEFSIPALKALIASRHKVLALVTQPDRKKGRTLKLSPPPAKVIALAHDIPVFQAENTAGEESVKYLRSLKPDLFVVISFGQILKKDVLKIPKLFALNVHGSLLPKYRGASPTNRAVMDGEKVTGVTVMRMNESMDEGDILLVKESVIDDDDTNITVSETLAQLGAKALIEAIGLIESNAAKFTPQDGKAATYAPKLKKGDGLIDWNEPAEKIRNKVRGLLPWPGAYTDYEGKTLKILKVELFGRPAGSAAPGEVLDLLKNKGIIVQTGGGSIAIQNLQLEGGKEMDADAFVRGHRIPKGYRFSRKD
jgi:methionyl-tRNA formyltransferase